MEFWSYPSRHRNSGPIYVIIGILILYFQTFEFLPYFYKHWYSGSILSNFGIMILSFQTVKFWSSFYKSYFSIHCNADPTFINIGFWLYPFRHWNSSPFLWALEFWSYLVKWARGPHKLACFPSLDPCIIGYWA